MKACIKGMIDAISIFCGKNTAIPLVNCGVFTAIFVYLQP
jgi:hypothetical protein